ncbi:hypothetical protein BCU12_06775 [Vibrio sp. 10N.261.55.A7]|nr:hypothetical protein BCU12_06775 [Vibrio sp. 10N.261.55.A7]
MHTEKLTQAHQIIGEVISSQQQELANQYGNREVFDIVHAINVLAMANIDVIHVFTEFSAHVNKFHVRAISAEQDYSLKRYGRLFSEDVFITDDGALEQLLSIESKLTELIIEAREEVETIAEISA